MAAVRIRGVWRLEIAIYDGGANVASALRAPAILDVHHATRAGLQGRMIIDDININVGGRVKPGSPAAVTLYEIDDEGQPLEYGLEALLFIPPWWPNIDYSFDYIGGTLVIGKASRAAGKHSAGKLISVSGIQPFE